MLTALTIALALQAAAPQLANPGFDESAAGWELAPGVPYRLETFDGAGRLAPIVGAPFGAARQSVDASAWRGRLVRFRARVRLARPGGSAALAMSVRRPPPKSAGFNDAMVDRPIRSELWQSYEIVGRVAANAERILVQVIARDGADVLVDDASLEAAEPDPAPPGAAASAYLDAALRILRDGHIDAPTADWPRIAANARAEIGGAATPRDTYAAIRGAIGELGEPHTSFRPPAPAAPAAPAAAAAEPPMPEHRLVAGRFGLVQLPAHLGTGAQNARYRDTLRRALVELDGQGVCGWIVDLRGNTGGNMWPMLNGLDPLLGEPPFGIFVTARRELSYWGRSQGAVLPAAGIGRDRPAFALRGAALPVAVLIDERTVSSGEMTAIAFAGRAASRSFGAPSGGFTTGNSIVPLADGAAIILTGVFVRDRTGRDYGGPIAPDEAMNPALAESAAIRWLGAQPSCRP